METKYSYPLQRLSLKEKTLLLSRNGVTFVNQHPYLFILLALLLGKILCFIGYGLLLAAGQETYPTVLGNMCRFDCNWYKTIIYDGYQLHANPFDGSAVQGQANWAFFPLFPMLARACVYLFHNEISIVIMNQLLVLGAMVILYQFCLENYSKSIGLFAAFLLGISSENIYFLSIYSESLFIFLSTLIIYLISKKQFYWAAFFCALISATRVQGCILLLPILFSYFQCKKDVIGIKKSLIIVVLLSIFSLSGLLLYMLYLKIHVNDALAFYHIQRLWRGDHEVFLNPIRTLQNVFWGRARDIITEILSVISVYYFYKKKKYNEMLFIGFNLALPMVTMCYTSYTRFYFSNYASYIFLADMGLQKRWGFFMMIVFEVFLTIFFTIKWILGMGLA